MDFTYNHYVNAILFLVLFLAGMFVLFRKKFILFLLIAIVFAISIVLHILQIYPIFNPIPLPKNVTNYPIAIRTSLFLIPLLLVSVAFALEKIFAYYKFERAFNKGKRITVVGA